MQNKYLENEYRDNITEHEVFSKQNYEDLEIIKSLLNKQPNNRNIFIEFDSTLLMGLPISYFSRNLSIFDIKEKWEHFVALEIMKKIQEKYKIEIDHDLKEEEKYIYTDNEEDYFRLKEILVNRDDVIEALKKINLSNITIHIFIKTHYNQEILDEISAYFINELSFKIIVYSTEELLFNDGNYIEYYEFNKGKIVGEKNRKIKSKKYEKEV